MNFPHYITVTRGGGTTGTPGGTQDPDEGTWEDDPTLPDENIVTKGRADVQDIGAATKRNEAGMPTLMSDATAFFNTEEKAKLCRPGDLVRIEWNDGTPDAFARIVKVRRLDGALSLGELTYG